MISILIQSKHAMKNENGREMQARNIRPPTPIYPPAAPLPPASLGAIQGFPIPTNSENSRFWFFFCLTRNDPAHLKT